MGAAPDIRDAPIGLFDSGVGGLTVLARIRALLPAERFLYVADQAHVPYGGRPLETVRGYAEGLSAELFERGAKAVVMACNISSATARDEVSARYPERTVLGVIEPGAESAVGRTRSGKIGVLATEGTARSRAYEDAVARLDPFARAIVVACPDFVPLVEMGLTEGPRAEDAARRYLAPILAAGADTVILGCTHYPYLLSVLRAAAPDVDFVDPAEHTARVLADALARAGRLRAPRAHGEPSILFTTGDLADFSTQLKSLVTALDYVAAYLEPRDAPPAPRSAAHGL